MYQLKLHKQVEKFLFSLPPPWRRRFYDKLEALRHDLLGFCPS